jgi:hypothetical protein
MAAGEFFRGPHDGLLLTMKQVERYCHLVSIKTGDDERLFAMMPSPVNWKRVILRKMPPDGPFNTVYPYELVVTDSGPVFVMREVDEFSEAGDEA